MRSLRSKIQIMTSMTSIKTIMTSKMTLKLEFYNFKSGSLLLE